jgi:hypothetical protein
MKKWIVMTAVVMFATGLFLGGAYVTLAQGNTPPIPFSAPGTSGWMGRGMMGNYGQAFTGTVPFGRGGMMRGWSYNQPLTDTAPIGPMAGAMMAPGGAHEQVWAAIAQELGMTYDQLQTELRTQTLAQLAESKGVKLDKLQEVAQAAHKAELNKLVEEGKLTREQADWMIQRMDTAGSPLFGQERGGEPCHGYDGDDDADPQGFGPRGGRGGRPGMMGRWG